MVLVEKTKRIPLLHHNVCGDTLGADGYREFSGTAEESTATGILNMSRKMRSFVACGIGNGSYWPSHPFFSQKRWALAIPRLTDPPGVTFPKKKPVSHSKKIKPASHYPPPGCYLLCFGGQRQRIPVVRAQPRVLVPLFPWNDLPLVGAPPKIS